MCVLAAVIASVAGCVGMRSNGPAEEFSASPQSSTPEGNLVGVVPSGPQPDENPSQIVQGFLIASASYPSYSVALEYLASSAVKTWSPTFAVTVFSSLNVPPHWVLGPKASHNAGQQASVLVSGAVQACFNGSGQYVSAQCQGQPSGAWNATLVKVNGQWRITNPPNSRMLPSSVFSLFYKAQNLYFFDPPLDQVLIPDSVFVPLGATVSQLVANLVSVLAQDPKTPWLEGATDTELPPGTRVQQVTTDGSTAIVNLGGDVAKASTKQLQLFAAQLVWTLTGSPPGPLSIQAVMLERNGRPWAPTSAPCPGGPTPGLQQTQAAYECFDPYPSSPASFYYVDRGQSWARCGSQVFGKQGFIGVVVPVVGRGGSFTSQRCDHATRSVREGYALLPSLQPRSLPAVSRAAVSPDGKYLAIVTAGKGYVYVGSLSGQAASFPSTPRLSQGGVTALSWDRNDNLWVVQNGSIVMLPPTGKGEIQVTFEGNVSDLKVAPDGVRIAFIAQFPGAPGPGIFLAAIGGGQNSVQLGTGGTHLSIRSYAPIGPNLSDPSSLAWYDADDLIVVADAPTTGNALWEVPVDGQQATQQVAPPNVTSITADGNQNVLVAGLSGNTLYVSTSLEGQWYQLGEQGAAPAYPG
jgi:hypothetical protein